MKNILLFAAVLLLSLNSFAQKKWAATGNYYFNGAVLAVCDDPAGNIYFSGTAKNTSSKYYVAKYDGTTVTEIGNSSLNISNYALTMCSDKKGNIYMAGYFMDSGAAYVVKWDGSTWAKVGYAKGPNSPNAANAIYSLCTDTAGNLYAAHGNAINRGGKYEWDIYKWDGKVWSIVGGTTGLKANKEATTITCDRDGNLYAGGRFTNDSGKCYIAKWDGTKWTELGKGGNELNANSLIWSVNADKKGNIYTAGTFTNSFGKIYVAKWNGTKWTTVGTDSSFENKNKGQIISVKTDDAGNVIIAGYYKNNKNEFYVGKYNDTSWSQVGKGFNANAYTMYVSSKNEILVGGNFIDSTNKNFLAMQLSQVVTAIENINTHAGYAIYPNPAHDFISINTKDIAPNTPYQIMDVMGKIVAKGTLGATTNIIDIAALNSGVYFITINGGLVQPVKFIKE